MVSTLHYTEYCGMLGEEDSWDNQAYRDYAEADFLEYASHKNEPDFNWDYYSDWHKDLYGFRPHH